MGPDPENRVGDQDIGRPGRPVSSGLRVPGEAEHSRARIVLYKLCKSCAIPYRELNLYCSAPYLWSFCNDGLMTVF
jgi:hypothetical protein